MSARAAPLAAPPSPRASERAGGAAELPCMGALARGGGRWRASLAAARPAARPAGAKFAARLWFRRPRERLCEVCGLALAPTPSRAPGAYFTVDAALPRGIAASWSTGCAVGPDAKTLPCLRGCQTVSRQGRACGRWAVGDAAADPRAAARHAAAYRCPGGVGVGSCGATQGAHASRRCQPASRCRGRPTWSRPRGAQPGAWFRV